MRAPKVILEMASMAPSRDARFYYLSRYEVGAVRSFLAQNRRKHKECADWLHYFRWICPGSGPLMDDVDDGMRFGAFCRQLLAMNGVVVAV